MSRLGTIARRTFLLGTAAIAGGVAFGYYQYARALPNPLPNDDGNHPITPYVTIDQDGVTIITPRAEMGQGVYTTLAALVAEELDVNWEDIRVHHGPPDQAYYNGGLMSHGLPVNDYERSGFQDMMIEAMTVIPKMAALQVTGGSTSMLDAYEKMRLAGASARETLKQAAADRLGLSRSAMATEGGAVIPPDGTPIPYADLAEAAAEIEPITRGTELRTKANWRYLGQSMPRTDMLGKSTGTAMFGSDVRLEGMKFATVRMSPRLGGEMLRFDASAAEAMAGVERVIDLGTGIAVVANNTWIAIQAAEAVEIEWGPAPYPETSDELMEVIRASLDNEPNSTLRNDGDADEPPLQSDIQIEAEYTMPWLAHSTMEPMNATAIYSSDALTLWCGTQAPILAEQKAAEAVGLDPEQVTCHVTYLGGGFGRRGEFDFAVLAARVAREVPDTPVKVTWSREEDMRHDFYRPAAAARMRGVIREGFAQTLDGRMAAPSVTQQSLMRIAGFSPPGPDKGHVEGMFNQPYAIPNYRVQGHLTDLAVPIGFWRSVGNSINGFFMESFIDEMAHAAGRDPLAFRLELARGEHAPSAGVLEAVADMANWSGETPDGIGRGVAMTFSFHTPVAIAMEVSDQDGVISMDRAWIACDVGTALDPGIIEQQMVSGLVYGLTAAVKGEISFSGGEVDQYNFPDYDALRIHQVPETEVRILETQHHIGGVGEPSTPPSMPALANAIYDLTGERVRDLPLNRRFDFVY
jgi:isoquinoline 1-oxidoreductase beta subunit